MEVKLLSNGKPVAVPVVGFFLLCDLRTSIDFLEQKKTNELTINEK
jgi:hypothetical protein